MRRRLMWVRKLSVGRRSAGGSRRGVVRRVRGRRDSRRRRVRRRGSGGRDLRERNMCRVRRGRREL